MTWQHYLPDPLNVHPAADAVFLQVFLEVPGISPAQRTRDGLGAFLHRLVGVRPAVTHEAFRKLLPLSQNRFQLIGISPAQQTKEPEITAHL